MDAWRLGGAALIDFSQGGVYIWMVSDSTVHWGRLNSSEWRPRVVVGPVGAGTVTMQQAGPVGSDLRLPAQTTGLRIFGRVTDWLERRLYPGYHGENDRFWETVGRYLTSDSVALDAGCGRGLFDNDFRRLVKTLIGCDVSPSALRNPFVHEVVIADLGRMPFDDDQFDVVFSRCVVEHLPDPAAVFREFQRVLKPGGRLVVLTPNLHHYIAQVSRATPHWFHELSARQRGWTSEDAFPTLYRANTRAKLMGLIQGAGLDVDDYATFEIKPDYLNLTPLTYLVGVLYERIVNRFESLRDLRAEIYLVARKPGQKFSENQAPPRRS
jgi:SAM-dependent methyltransferase